MNFKQKTKKAFKRKYLGKMVLGEAHPVGFEPTTYGLEIRHFDFVSIYQ